MPDSHRPHNRHENSGRWQHCLHTRDQPLELAKYDQFQDLCPITSVLTNVASAGKLPAAQTGSSLGSPLPKVNGLQKTGDGSSMPASAFTRLQGLQTVGTQDFRWFFRKKISIGSGGICYHLCVQG